MATKKQNTEIVSLFEEKAGAGIGEVSADDLATPRIVMIQPGSPQIKKSSTKYLADASVGDLLFTATNTIVDGEEGIRFLPVYFVLVATPVRSGSHGSVNAWVSPTCPSSSSSPWG